MNHYKHFTLKEREMIKHYLDIGKNQTEISMLLNRNKSSISRELKRNNINGEYFPCEAQYSYVQRRLCCKPKKKLENPTLYKCVKNLFLNHQWSPEQISERLKVEGFNYTVSYNTIIGESMKVYLMNLDYLVEIEVLYENLGIKEKVVIQRIIKREEAKL